MAAKLRYVRKSPCCKKKCEIVGGAWAWCDKCHGCFDPRIKEKK